MDRVSTLEDKQVLGTDGNLIGWVKGLTFAAVGDWKVTGVTIKLEKESHEELGQKKPLMGAAMLDFGVENVKTVSDNVLLNQAQRAMKPHLRAHAESRSIIRVIDRTVVDSNGKDIGVVEDVMVDTTRWMFPSILIKLEKEVLQMLRMEKCPDCERRVTIPMGNVQTIGDRVMLNISKEGLGDLVKNVPVKTM